MATPVATATPSRERSSTSQSASSPTSMRPQASSSAASIAASALGQTANTTTYPISLETLLATHASAPNPILAALDQVLSERNILSTQNTQLWKLIEKQRAAYNQVLKEIERVRSERDTYKARLQSAGMSTELAKKDKDREKDKARSLRSSGSNATMSSMSVNGSADLRSRMVRNQLDTTCEFLFHFVLVTFPTTAFPASPSRNDDRPVTPPCLPETSTRDPNLETPQTTMSTRPFNSPLVVPPRGTSLSLAATSAATFSSGATSPGSTSQSSVDLEMPPVPRTTESRSPSQQPSAPPPSLQSVHLPPPVSLRPAHPPITTLQPPAPSINTLVPLYGSAVSPNGSTTSPISTSNTASQTGLLSPMIDNSQHPSRASRISSVTLPDEAKLYITSMGESPLPSPSIYPHMAGFNDDVQCHAGQAPPADSVPRTESPTIMLTKEQRDEVGEFLDMDDDEREDETIAKYSKTKNKPHAAVEDFPMPPSHGAIHISSSSHTQSSDPALMLTPTQSNPQPSATASTPSRAHWQPQREMLQSDDSSVLIPESPLPTSYLSPINPTSSSGTSATFRALPLLPGDLATTRVAVSHSSVKPNDRGKEVLSFVIDVHPGHGKESWKVEKLYSDVLTLDNRMRASVGKGVGKKMAVLPEGKIWRDHAPAKSDQRKVSTICSLVIVVSYTRSMPRSHSRCTSNH
jgi:RalA-binding protein 1